MSRSLHESKSFVPYISASSISSIVGASYSAFISTSTYKKKKTVSRKLVCPFSSYFELIQSSVSDRVHHERTTRGRMDQTLKKMRITDTQVANKAKEIYRRIDFPLRNDIAKNWISLDLACSVLSHQFHRETAIKCSTTSKRDYMKSLQAVESRLELNKFDLKSLLVQFGCIAIEKRVVSLVDSFFLKYVSKQSKSQQEYLQKQKDLFTKVAFYLIASKDTKIDKRKLGVEPKVFANSCLLMSEHCQEDIEKTETVVSVQKTTHIHSMIPLVSLYESKKYSEFLKWKESIIESK